MTWKAGQAQDALNNRLTERSLETWQDGGVRVVHSMIAKFRLVFIDVSFCVRAVASRVWSTYPATPGQHADAVNQLPPPQRTCTSPPQDNYLRSGRVVPQSDRAAVSACHRACDPTHCS